MIKQNSLIQILELLKKNRKDITVPVPSYWIFYLNDNTGKIYYANLYDLFISVIEDYILPKADEKIDYQKPLPKIQAPVIYGSFIRTTTAFDFDMDNKLSLYNSKGLRETGTILRMLLLLPFLKKLGINMIYLLPVTLHSEMHKKGEAPSPYSVKNFLKIDKYLSDPMLGEFSDKLLETEFKSFIYASHILNIKVVLDFIPRTVSRDNDLILEHPNWFYWIKKEYEENFKPPYIPKLPMTSFIQKYTKKIYTAAEVKGYLKKFTFSPDIIDRKKWKRLVKKIREERINNFLDIISDEFGVTTVPGFSDVINDTQPIWKDVTFLRLYLDHPQDALKYLAKDQPPYVLYDVIKASRAKFKKPNTELWKFLAKILPYYQKNFGIDGVRIDMGHALPQKLENKIIKSALRINKKFFLIAEELDNRNSAKAKKAGYNSIIGNLWAEEPRWIFGNIKRVFEKDLSKLSLPIFATAETHDTPRTITRHGKKRFHLFVAALNFFLPNSIPFINSGFEIKETQPMNKGLDTDSCNLYLLPKKDINYGKLALFDFTTLHWNNNSEKVIKLIQYCSKVRENFPEITKFKNFVSIKILPENKYIFGYMYKVKNGFLLFLVNTHLKKSFKINFSFKNYQTISGTIQSILNTDLYYRKNIFIERKLHKRLKYKNHKYFIKLKGGEISIILFGKK